MMTNRAGNRSSGKDVNALALKGQVVLTKVHNTKCEILSADNTSNTSGGH